MPNMDVLTIIPGGVMQGLFTEAIPLAEIGILSITRASTIEFEPASQQWEVRGVSGQVLYSNASRQACLSWEHQYFNQQMLESSSIPNPQPMT